MLNKGSIFIANSLALFIMIVTGQQTSYDKINIASTSPQQAASTQQLQQTWESDQLVISIPQNTGVMFELEYKNGSQQTCQQNGPSAQFLSLEDVDKIVIIPDRSRSSESNSLPSTIILSSDEFSIEESASKEVDSASFLTGNNTMKIIQQQLYGKNLTKIPMPVDSVNSSTHPLNEQFSTLANIQVDARENDFGLSSQTAASPLYSSTPTTTTATFQEATFQRGLPPLQTPTYNPPPPMKSKNNSYSNNLQSPQPNTQVAVPVNEMQNSNLNEQVQQIGVNLQQQINSMEYGYTNLYNSQSAIQNLEPRNEQEYQDLNLRQIQDINLNSELELNYKEYSQQEMEIMSVEYDNGIYFYDNAAAAAVGGAYVEDHSQATFKMSGLQLPRELNQQENMVADQNEQECIPMKELIKKNGGELFQLAIEVLDLQFESLGKIVSVFLPDAGAFEEFLSFIGVDLSKSPIISLTQQQILKQLVQSHIVPNALILNLASIATHAGTPLQNLNQQVFNIALQNNNNNNVIITPQNIEVVSSVPEIACEGFVFQLKSVLSPGDFVNSP